MDFLGFHNILAPRMSSLWLEWYFLPVYAILRSKSNKSGGVAAIGLVFVSLFALPFINTSYVRSSSFQPIHQKLFWLLLADCLLVGWIGCQPVEAPYVTIRQIVSIGFFFYFSITPILGKLQARLIQNSNVCEDLSPRKLSHILKNLLDVVK
jgi:ubiquinol-cytochrome c reductase cytochrome b subunit